MVDLAGQALGRLPEIGPVGRQTSRLYEVAEGIHRGQTVGCRQFRVQLAMWQKKASRTHDRRIGAFPDRLVEQPSQLLGIELLRQDAEHSEPEMACRSAQFLRAGAIPF